MSSGPFPLAGGGGGGGGGWGDLYSFPEPDLGLAIKTEP